MTDRLRSAAWVAAYAATLGAVVGGLCVAPWATGVVLAVGVGWALSWVLRVPLGGP